MNLSTTIGKHTELKAPVTFIFKVLYFVNLFCLLLMKYYGAGILSKIRYVYIGILFLLVIYMLIHGTQKDKFIFGDSVKILFPFILHTFLFCCVFTNSTIIDSTESYFQELVLFISSLILSAYFVIKFNLFDEIIKISYWCVALFMLHCYVLNFNGLAPFRYITRIFSSSRVRFRFGMSSYVEAGMYACLGLTLSIYMLFIKKGFSFKRIRIELLLQLILDFVLFLMMISTACRGAIVELAMFALLTIYYNLRKHVRLSLDSGNKNIFLATFVIICVILAVCFFVFDWYIVMWQVSGSRMQNYTVNSAIFESYGNPLLGLGYASHSIFLNRGYGYATTALDVLYLYIYFSTGLVGFLIIVWQLLILAVNVFKPSDRSLENSFLVRSIFIIMLFDGFYEISFFGVGQTNYIYLLLIITYCIEEKLTKITDHNNVKAL